jgi:hypothetical protein
MIEELKFLIDQSEDNPKIKEILLKVAKMPEHKQKATLEIIRIFLQSKLNNEDK